MSVDARRILIVATAMGRGGAERQIVDLARHLHGRGWTVGIVSMIPASGEHVRELEDAGIEVVSLDMSPRRPTPAALRRYVSVVRGWRPDIVHSHMVHANLLARAGRPLLRSTPVISTVHSLVEGGRWREVAYRLTDRLANVTTAVSTAVATRCVRSGAVPRRRIVTMRNGLDQSNLVVPDGAPESIRRELQVGETEVLWVAMGRLVPAKGFDVLLSAFRIVLHAAPNARLAIAGSGPEGDSLRRLRDELDLGESVSLLGDRTDGPSLLAAADAFVLSSRWEGLPMVVLEAAALARPVVATAVGGAEAMDPRTGAVLTDPTPESIAAGMLAVTGMDAGERARIGAEIQRHVLTTFDMARTVDRWERLYDTVLATKDHPARVDWERLDFSA